MRLVTPLAYSLGTMGPLAARGVEAPRTFSLSAPALVSARTRLAGSAIPLARRTLAALVAPATLISKLSPAYSHATPAPRP